MAVEKVYRCDLCGEYVTRDALKRAGVRGLDDRPEDADTVDIGPCCHTRPVADLLIHAAQLRREIIDG